MLRLELLGCSCRVGLLLGPCGGRVALVQLLCCRVVAGVLLALPEALEPQALEAPAKGLWERDRAWVEVDGIHGTSVAPLSRLCGDVRHKCDTPAALVQQGCRRDIYAYPVYLACFSAQARRFSGEP